MVILDKLSRKWVHRWKSINPASLTTYLGATLPLGRCVLVLRVAALFIRLVWDTLPPNTFLFVSWGREEGW